MTEAIYEAACEVRGAINELKIGIDRVIDKLTATIEDRADQLIDAISTPPITFKERPRRMIRLGTDTIVNADSLQSAKFHQLSEERSIVTMQLVGGTAIAAEATPEQFRLLIEAMEGKPENTGARYYLVHHQNLKEITVFRYKTIEAIEKHIGDRNLDDFEVIADDSHGVRRIDLAGYNSCEIPSLLS